MMALVVVAFCSERMVYVSGMIDFSMEQVVLVVIVIVRVAERENNVRLSQ